MNKKRKDQEEVQARGVPAWLSKFWRLMHRGDSVGWLVVTTLQALLTWSFIGIAKLSEGLPWEPQVKMLVIVAIVATWCMALRTIRVRLVELFRQWNRAPAFILRKASESAVQQLPARLKAWHKDYVRKSVMHLRIIAAGITMPFFILPVFTAAVCVALCWHQGTGDINLLGLAMMLTVMTVVVGAYFHWSVLPPAVHVRTNGRRRNIRRLQRISKL